ncbi:MFS transporter [Inquilinus sp. NPDC058860]|uniref:MFS transporter n=1 Tax=Inquilinus sp. NPDC058860 TaxID=3346652 RepID=UPI003684132B
MGGFSARGSVSVAPYVTVREGAPGARQERGWSAQQALVVALCFVINMLDGMDVLILSYIAPSLSADWGVRPDRLGVVFSAGLAGMAIGGLFVAPLADRYGRRRLILVSIVLMTAAMIASGFADTIGHLIALRLMVGIGIGAVLASMAALTAEYAPPRHRDFAVGFLQAGYPIGATITGFVVAWQLPIHGWHAMLLGAGLLSAATIPVVALLLPESMDFLARRQPAGALPRINRLRRRFGQEPLARLPDITQEAAAEAGPRGLFAQGRTGSTLLLWLAIILCFMTLYFVISWIPKLAVEAGLDTADAIYAGAIYNIGAFFGTASIGLIAAKVDLRRLIFLYLLGAAAALILFGSGVLPLGPLLIAAFLIGVAVQGGFNGLYPLAARLYPAEARGTGIGWAMGVGRIGAVIGPLLGGWLLAAEVSLPVIFVVFAVPVVLGGACVLLIRTGPR